MDSERSKMSILTGWQQFKINSTYFQPSLIASTPSNDPLAIPVKKGENLWEAALEGECHFKGEQLKTVFIKFIVQFYFMLMVMMLVIVLCFYYEFNTMC